MKRVLAIGLGVGLGVATLAGLASAQVPPGPGQDGGFGPERGGMERGGMERGGMMMGWHHRRMMLMGGSHFHFRRGDADVDIQCSNQETLQACVTAATTLIDKLHSDAQPSSSQPSAPARPAQ